MYFLNRFEKWMLNRILRKIVHKRGLDMLISQIYDEMRIQYHEDNIPTRVSYLREIVDQELKYKSFRELHPW